MLLQVISQSNTVEEDRTEVYTISNLFGVADFQFVRPGVLWVDGVSYFAATEENTVSNNKIQNYRYIHRTKSFYNTTVGTGTDVLDSFNHPRAFIWNEGGYLYTGQSNPHNSTIDLYKSNVQGDINGGYTELSVITGNNAYPKIFTAIDNTTCISSRTGSSAPDFNLSVNKSNAGIEGTFTQLQITGNSDSNLRFYNEKPIKYGNNTIDYFVGNVRYQPTAQYVSQFVLTTTDYNTFSSYDGAFSKDISVSGTITNTEIGDYCLINQTLSDTYNTGYMLSIQVDDVFYGIVEKSDGNHYIFKIVEGVMTETLITIPNFDKNKYIYYNGNNILITCRVDEGIDGIKNKIYGVPLDLSSFTEVFSVDADSSQSVLNLPENLDIVDGEYAIPLSISSNDFSVYLTSDKFNV